MRNVVVVADHVLDITQVDIYAGGFRIQAVVDPVRGRIKRGTHVATVWGSDGGRLSPERVIRCIIPTTCRRGDRLEVEVVIQDNGEGPDSL